MRLFSLEELAERWTFAHTITVIAWAVVVVLGALLLLRNAHDPYPATRGLKTYAGENATFLYPDNWTINHCQPSQPFIELPGFIETDYKGHKNYSLTVYGSVVFNCLKDRPERFDIYPGNLSASDTPCAVATSTKGEQLKNGLYLQLQEQGGKVVAIYIKQNACYAPGDTAVMAFGFMDPNAKPSDVQEFGTPRVKRDDFLASRQYQDIRALAESIKY